eukprot:scaffold1569_cov171-Amphora_coffeaeformis.AAC.5
MVAWYKSFVCRFVTSYSASLRGGSKIVHASKTSVTKRLIAATPPHKDDRFNLTRRIRLAACINRLIAATFTNNGTNSRVYPKLVNQTCVKQVASVGFPNPRNTPPAATLDAPANKRYRNSICAYRKTLRCRCRYNMAVVPTISAKAIPPRMPVTYRKDDADENGVDFPDSKVRGYDSVR